MREIPRSLIVLVGFWLVIIGTVIFGFGFHNIDLSRNILMMSYIEKLDYFNYVDGTLSGQDIDYDTAYLNGLRGIVVGFGLSMAGACIFGTGLRK